MVVQKQRRATNKNVDVNKCLFTRADTNLIMERSERRFPVERVIAF